MRNGKAVDGRLFRDIHQVWPMSSFQEQTPGLRFAFAYFMRQARPDHAQGA